MTDINKMQRILSIAQSKPIVGPILVSPIKGLVSLAQIITGFSKAVIFGTFSLSSAVLNNPKAVDWSGSQMLQGFCGMFNGTCSLIYSCSNICTLGVTGLVCEAIWLDIKT